MNQKQIQKLYELNLVMAAFGLPLGGLLAYFNNWTLAIGCWLTSVLLFTSVVIARRIERANFEPAHHRVIGE